MTSELDILTIERKRLTMSIPREHLCRAAGVGRNTYREALNGRPPYPSTLAKLNTALRRFKTGFGGEAINMAPHAAFTACIVLAAFWMNADARSALTSQPSRRANGNPEWHQAAKVRQLGYWIANQFLGFRQADIGRAANVSKQAVQTAITEIEIGRDHDAELDRICSQIEKVFEG